MKETKKPVVRHKKTASKEKKVVKKSVKPEKKDVKKMNKDVKKPRTINQKASVKPKQTANKTIKKRKGGVIDSSENQSQNLKSVSSLNLKESFLRFKKSFKDNAILLKDTAGSILSNWNEYKNLMNIFEQAKTLGIDTNGKTQSDIENEIRNKIEEYEQLAEIVVSEYERTNTFLNDKNQE